MYISIDGPNGSGKSSTLETLATHLRRSGLSVTVVRGVDNSHALGQLIHCSDRQYKTPPIVNHLLIAAEKYYSYDNQILPLLKKGEIVLSDRHLITCVAYAFLYQEDPEYTWSLYSRLPSPAINICLDAHPETLQKRLSSRSELSYSETVFTRERERGAFLEAVCFAKARHLNISCIDTTNLSQSGVLQTVLETLNTYAASRPVNQKCVA